LLLHTTLARLAAGRTREMAPTAGIGSFLIAAGARSRANDSTAESRQYGRAVGRTSQCSERQASSMFVLRPLSAAARRPILLIDDKAVVPAAATASCLLRPMAPGLAQSCWATEIALSCRIAPATRTPLSSSIKARPATPLPPFRAASSLVLSSFAAPLRTLPPPHTVLLVLALAAFAAIEAVRLRSAPPLTVMSVLPSSPTTEDSLASITAVSANETAVHLFYAWRLTDSAYDLYSSHFLPPADAPTAG